MIERLDHFMARANATYYATRDPFADFTTAPELCQAFGEVLGVWAAVVWQSMGQPDSVLLVEAGPGRGTLMADARRAISQVAPDFAAAMRVHLIETSPRLRAIQAERVGAAEWHDALSDLPPGPLILLANEFLDALPVRQFVRREQGWVERYVHDHAFVECAADPLSAAAEEGEVVEIRPAALDFARELGARLVRKGGAALVIDYGPSVSAPGDSLQALRQGVPTNPLVEPGSADITAHVDFAAVAAVARESGAGVFGPTSQGRFLSQLGLVQRAATLARSLPAMRAAAMMQAAQRLTEPDRMGLLFKALAVSHPALPTPPGFEA